MTTLYITRHGETEWNIQRRMQGWQDSPLTELGKSQAAWLGERLKEIDIDVIYSSPLERAYNTANIIRGEREIEIVKNDAFKEIKLGSWEGLSHEQIEAIDEEQLYNFWHAPALYKSSTGEIFEDVINRTHIAVEEILNKYKGKNVLIVTHAVAAKAMMYYFESRTLDQFWDPPFMHQTSLSVIEVDEDKHKVILHADTSHYKK